MNEKFILLTTTENNPIIIGVSNIASVQTSRTHPETILALNYTTGEKQTPETIHVIDSFEQIKTKLGL